jgi:hypothetical protein
MLASTHLLKMVPEAVGDVEDPHLLPPKRHNQVGGHAGGLPVGGAGSHKHGVEEAIGELVGRGGVAYERNALG